MTEGKLRAQWQQTSLLAAGIFQANRDPKKKALKPSDFDPFAEKAPEKIGGVAELKAAFLGNKRK